MFAANILLPIVRAAADVVDVFFKGKRSEHLVCQGLGDYRLTSCMASVLVDKFSDAVKNWRWTGKRQAGS